MIRKVAYGEVNKNTENFRDVSKNELFVLGVILLIILVLGFYPRLITDLIAGTR